jgi:uncharacterized membrane protein
LKIFPWQKKKSFFTDEEKHCIIATIREAEQRTSGEIRVYVESRCRYMDAVDRAAEIFSELGMHQTAERNATLVYVAVKDKQAAIFGDEGIDKKVGQKYWEEEVNKMLLYFKEQHLADGICKVVTDIGEALQFNFPFNRTTDKNELPDDLVFGK